MCDGQISQPRELERLARFQLELPTYEWPLELL